MKKKLIFLQNIPLPRYFNCFRGIAQIQRETESGVQKAADGTLPSIVPSGSVIRIWRRGSQIEH